MPISLDRVSVWYESGGRRVFGLHDVSFAPAEKRVTLVVGPSGSGKSTLLSVLGLLLEPQQGEVAWAGRRLSSTGSATADHGDLRLRGIGFVFQTANLLSSCSALENVMLPGVLAGMTRSAARDRAAGLLAEVGLAERAHARPAQLSGGEAQRVALCRALMNRPDMLLADEPTAALDAAARGTVTRLLRAMADEQGATVVVVTHDLRLRDIADDVVTLRDGVLERSEA